MLISSRANAILLVLMLAVGVTIVAMLATGVRGGPLDPPAAPASTDGVRESGTPISSLPFTITQPGRYYVTRDLTGLSSQNGITISQDNVTVDLNGFTLHGVGGTGDGVFVSGAHTAITIENGVVRGWFNGIDANTATVSRISGVQSIANGQGSFDGSYGILIGAGSVVEDCTIANNRATGLLAFKIVVRNCLVTGNGNDGVLAAGGAFLQNNKVRLNNTIGGAFPDVRFVDNGNDMTDNELGFVMLDLTSSSAIGVLARNTVCSISTNGGGGSDVVQKIGNIDDDSC